MSAQTVVIDINVLVNAVAPEARQSWDPKVLDPISNKAKVGRMARAMLTVLDNERLVGTGRYSLVASEHVMSHVQMVLSGAAFNGRTRSLNKGWSPAATLAYMGWIDELASATGGDAWLETPSGNAELCSMFPDEVWTSLGASVDHEDRNILALALRSRAEVVVTNDVNLLALGESLGFTRVISPERFLEEHMGVKH